MTMEFTLYNNSHASIFRPKLNELSSLLEPCEQSL